MAFYSPDAAMGEQLGALVTGLEQQGRPGLSERLAITWLRYPGSLLQEAIRPSGGNTRPEPGRGSRARGACWRGAEPQDPGGLERLAYLVASERWLQRDLLADGPELRQALEAMVRRASHGATGLVLDLLSGTTSGPALPPERQRAWERQRQLVNSWLTSLAWSELEGCNLCQKTWSEEPYGREQAFLRPDRSNVNRLSSDGLARLLEGVIHGTLVSPPACTRMRALLQWHPPVAPEPQAAGATRQLSPATPGWGQMEIARATPATLAVLAAAMPLWGLAAAPQGSGSVAIYAEPTGQLPSLLVLLGPDLSDPALVTALSTSLLAPQADGQA